jgi:hypothetical protein
MASVGGDVAGADRNDFEVGAFGEGCIRMSETKNAGVEL